MDQLELVFWFLVHFKNVSCSLTVNKHLLCKLLYYTIFIISLDTRMPCNCGLCHGKLVDLRTFQSHLINSQAASNSIVDSNISELENDSRDYLSEEDIDGKSNSSLSSNAVDLLEMLHEFDASSEGSVTVTIYLMIRV